MVMVIAGLVHVGYLGLAVVAGARASAAEAAWMAPRATRLWTWCALATALAGAGPVLVMSEGGLL